MNIQTEVQKIHHTWGTSEKANYEIQKLVDEAILPFKIKSEKWDKLDAEIGEYYQNEDDEDDEDDDSEGSLLDIGETAAIAFGYL
jgi:hypothetical protein